MLIRIVFDDFEASDQYSLCPLETNSSLSMLYVFSAKDQAPNTIVVIVRFKEFHKCPLEFEQMAAPHVES